MFHAKFNVDLEDLVQVSLSLHLQCITYLLAEMYARFYETLVS